MRTPTSTTGSAKRASLGAAITIEALDDDPFTIYQRLRDEEPVAWVPAAHAYLITRWDDVHRVCRDAETFSAAVHDSPLSQSIGPNLLHSDGAYHDRLRAPLTEGLRPSVIKRTMEGAIQDTVRGLLAEFRPGEVVDLVTGFAQTLAVRVLQRVTGLPEIPVAVFTEWVDGIAAGAANYERDPDKQRRADEASAAVDDMLRDQLRLGPKPGTLLAGLTASGATFEEIAATTKLLIIGGMQEPRDLFGHALIAYLTDPAVRQEIDRDKTMIARLIEEALRIGAPVGTVTRRVTKPTRVAGQLLDEGSLVLAVLASANRDPRHWDEPDEFRLLREHNQHLSFSAGVHACVGSMLARAQAHTALEEFLTAYPAIQLAEEPVIRGWEFRGPTQLKVRLGNASGPSVGALAVAAHSAPAVPLRVLDIDRSSGDAAIITVGREKGGELPPWTPGAHVDLTFDHAGQTFRRSYSLCGDPADRSTWRFGVRRAAQSRGGSAFLVEELMTGARLEAAPPRNAFALTPAPACLLVAGGIGITPLLPMARSLAASGASWQLLYIGRDRDSMPFLDEVEALGPAAEIWTTKDRGRPVLTEWLGSLPQGGEVYACGPSGLLDELAASVTGYSGISLRVERFGSSAGAAAASGGRAFSVRLARAQKELMVPADRTLLETLEEAGVMIPSTCREGICGSCETAVLEGAVDHRDQVLSDEEKERGDLMLVCVSRCRGEHLTLDL
ncbi:cytochrome P450 [Streptomyces sp. NEAU-Y11]|uniref:cytochrome P450 n=1 Tax=Streptomyces cucumeris TaxID=2962890 RepID=UPI0020C90829|nr:cytochrome P450 [Streptomyces sp. NEAU-Y11]MCP9211130.1 cytochrome P450 [Streptomyces sp. NEAU-Y11]